MTRVWDMLGDFTREELRKYQWRSHRKRLTIPEDGPPVTVKYHNIGSPEEIDKFMRQRPRHRGPEA